MTTVNLNAETRFTGLPISGGVALARVCLLNENRHSNLPTYTVDGEGITREQNRVRQGIRSTSEQLDVLTEDVADRIGPAEAQIFKAQKAILGDPVLVEKILDRIEKLSFNAESAVTHILEDYQFRLLKVDSEYIKERATDIGEVQRRLLDAISHMNPALQCADEDHCQQGHHRVVVAAELTPGLTVELQGQSVVAFVTEHGGPTSHAAILARASGIPAVSRIKDIHSILSCGTQLLVDGDSGEVIAWPSEQTIARFRSQRTLAVQPTPAVGPIAELTVMANISRADGVSEALDMQAEGIGLYRTEFEFLAAGRILSEDEQFQRYASVVEAMAGRPVCFRLLDIGADKGAAFFNLPPEDNPSLGYRGSRLLLNRPDLLTAQARALARASAVGPVDVLYPMIVDLEQFLQLKRLFCDAIADLPCGRLRHGVMFEVPSACLEARELLEHADFASIGTNDLIQYLFAVDRNNELVAYDYTPDRPVFWSLLGRIADAAAETGRTVSVCGEAAGNPQFVPKLLELGLRTLSVSPRFIPQLRLAALNAREGA